MDPPGIQLENREMNQDAITTRAQGPLVEISEVSATKGDWAAPAVDKVSLALVLSDFSARWRGRQGLRTENVSAGAVAICEIGGPRRFEMRNPAEFGIVTMPNELWSKPDRRLGMYGLSCRPTTCSTIRRCAG